MVVGDILKAQEKRDKYVACICAAPIALKSHSVGKGKKLTSHPAVQKKMEEAGNFKQRQPTILFLFAHLYNASMKHIAA